MKRKKTILLVEDEALITVPLKLSLENTGYTVYLANTGEKAVEKCKTDTGIELVLMDIELGRGIDGTEAAGQILSERDLPIVFLSSHTDTEMLEKVKKISSYGYVLKNAGVHVLEASIQMAFSLFEAKKKTDILLSAAQAIINSKTKEEICSNLLTNFSNLIGADRISLFLLDTEKRDILLNLAHGFENNSVPIGYEELMEGLTGAVIRGGKAIRSTDPEDGIEPEATKKRRYADGVGSLIVAPLKAEGKIIGTITVINGFDQRKFSEGDVKVLTALAEQAGDAINRIHLEEQLRDLLAEKELLIKEVHHRIKNNMNTIYGLLVLQAGNLKEASAVNALEDAGGRVRSMMMLYDKLYRSVDVTEISVQKYLPHLIDEIIANFPNNKSVRIDKYIEDFVLDAKTLQPVGIILNELLTNIMKYAFTEKTEGVISVSVSLKGRHVSIVVADNGNGMPETVDFGHSTGFGLVLVNGLVKQVCGTIRIERGEGTKIVLEFDK